MYQLVPVAAADVTTDNGVGTVVRSAGSWPVGVYLGSLVAAIMLVKLVGGKTP